MEHDVLFTRDSWMRFIDRSYHTPAALPGNDRFLEELTLSFPGLHGTTALFLILRPTLSVPSCI